MTIPHLSQTRSTFPFSLFNQAFISLFRALARSLDFCLAVSDDNGWFPSSFHFFCTLRPCLDQACFAFSVIQAPLSQRRFICSERKARPFSVFVQLYSCTATRMDSNFREFILGTRPLMQTRAAAVPLHGNILKRSLCATQCSRSVSGTVFALTFLSRQKQTGK